MKRIAVLGSTGSIGRQTLSVARMAGASFGVAALSAGGHEPDLIVEQANEFHPELVCVRDEKAAAAIAPRLPEGTRLEAGENASLIAAALPDADIIVNGISGFAGMAPLIEALRAGKPVALANKESVICAHTPVKRALEKGGSIIPVDSEQSALFQCLAGGRHSEVARLILTASGGPFRLFDKAKLKNVRVEDALKHPVWSMGAKITIDSATLFNKGLEIMEASYLFDIPGERIDVLVHPEVAVHSMVEFCDTSVIAQLAVPDMRIAIHYALTYPEREACRGLERLDLASLGSLTFEKPDTERFPAIPLAYAALKEGHVLPIVYNAANEVAVGMFARGEIGFYDIPARVEYAMAHIGAHSDADVESINAADSEARMLAQKGKLH